MLVWPKNIAWGQQLSLNWKLFPLFSTKCWKRNLFIIVEDALRLVKLFDFSTSPPTQLVHKSKGLNNNRINSKYVIAVGFFVAQTRERNWRRNVRVLHLSAIFPKTDSECLFQAKRTFHSSYNIIKPWKILQVGITQKKKKTTVGTLSAALFWTTVGIFSQVNTGVKRGRLYLPPIRTKMRSKLKSASNVSQTIFRMWTTRVGQTDQERRHPIYPQLLFRRDMVSCKRL